MEKCSKPPTRYVIHSRQLGLVIFYSNKPSDPSRSVSIHQPSSAALPFFMNLSFTWGVQGVQGVQFSIASRPDPTSKPAASCAENKVSGWCFHPIPKI